VEHQWAENYRTVDGSILHEKAHDGGTESRGDLLHTAWGYPSIGITRTVDVHIQHLRRKLGLKQEIQTIYRVGYTLS